MVIVRLIGGLGNQLFQYAAGRRIAYFHDVPLKFDISWFERVKSRKYSLSHFNIIEDIASSDDITRLKGKTGIGKFISRFFEVGRPYYERSAVREQFLHFDPNILKVSGNVYLNGYWGSEKYFKDIEDILRRELTVKTEPSAINIAMAERISQVLAVSMHIRRGDFVSNPITHQFHGLCSLDYYNMAIDRIAQMVEKPYFFIFSDDPQWVQENLNPKYPVTFVTHNSAEKDYEDLRLMSMCKHHIIANSTFGWWGAWLNPDPQRIVFAPRQWFNEPGLDTRDLLPDGWIKL